MSVGLLQFLPMLIWTLLFGGPFFFMLAKAGFSRWWLLLLLVPVLGVVILLWIVALSPWSTRPSAAEVFE